MRTNAVPSLMLHVRRLAAAASTDEQLLAAFLATVNARHEKPLFAYIHLLPPHAPYTPPGPLGTRFENAGTFVNRFSATQHDGVAAVRQWKWDSNCSCGKYTSGNIDAP